jgi:hypothetical protein
MESEYMVAADVANEAVWLQKFVIELGVFRSMRYHVHMFCDHMAEIVDTELRAHSIDKPILRRYHVIRDYVKDGKVKVCKVHMGVNVADPLTRRLP